MITHFETEAKRRSELFLGVFALVAIFAMLGEHALWGPEGVWAEGVRIVTSGTLTTTGRELIVYQLARLPVEFLGLTEAAVRLPGALASILGLWGTIQLAKHFFHRRVALCSGWLLLGCYGFLLWGRMATGDMIALATGVWLTELNFSLNRKSGYLLWLAWHLVWMLGSILCGVFVCVVPLALVIPHWASYGNWRLFFSWKNVVCFLLSALLICGVLAVFALSTSGNNGFEENLSIWINQILWQNQLRLEEWQRAVYDVEAWGSVLYNLPRITLPWTPLMVVALAGVIKNYRRLSNDMGNLLRGYLLAIIILALLPDSHWQYGLPLLPVTVLLSATGLLTSSGEEQWNWYLEKFYRGTAMVVGSILVATIAALPLWQPLLGVNPPGLAAILMPLTGVLALLVLLFGNQPDNFVERCTGLPGSLASTILAGVILVTGIISFVRPALNEFRTGKPFWLELKKNLNEQAANTVLFYDTKPNGDDLFYLNLSYRPAVASNEQGFRHFVEANRGRRVAIVSRNQGKKLEELQMVASANKVKINLDEPNLREQPRLRFNPDDKMPEDRGFRAWVINL